MRRRLEEHRLGLVDGFTKKYKVDRLMHYEIFHDPHNAGNRERQIKKFRREKKIALFIEANPQWQDRNKDFVVPYKEALLQAAGRRE